MVLAGKCDFIVLAGKTRFYDFGEKHDFTVLAGKNIFMLLARKLYLRFGRKT